jgi:hypothetical protein
MTSARSSSPARTPREEGEEEMDDTGGAADKSSRLERLEDSSSEVCLQFRVWELHGTG